MSSEPFTYTVADDGRIQSSCSPTRTTRASTPAGPTGLTAPRYAQQYVDALTAAGVSLRRLGRVRPGRAAPPRRAQPLRQRGLVPRRQPADPGRGGRRHRDVRSAPLEDAAVAERQQYLTLAVRDYLNEGGKLALTGETTGYYGPLGTALGGIYYGLDGAPDEDCVVTADFFSDCLLLADDFTQYYLGAFSRGAAGGAGVPGGDRRADHRH